MKTLTLDLSWIDQLKSKDLTVVGPKCLGKSAFPTVIVMRKNGGERLFSTFCGRKMSLAEIKDNIRSAAVAKFAYEVSLEVCNAQKIDHSRLALSRPPSVSKIQVLIGTTIQ